ncbi:MAG: endonuclease YncB(thermonuclease family) [Lentimonas sp.]|jgi:endonuclease YncB( thermonuclease family)
MSVNANYLDRAKIINVVDGDTLLLDVIKRQRFRLAQIDCAEMKTPEGKNLSNTYAIWRQVWMMC